MRELGKFPTFGMQWEQSAMYRMSGAAVWLSALLALSACARQVGTYVLYRSSPIDATMRIHVSTFDAADGDTYNRGNCEVAAGLFQAQQGVTVRYWCEKGPFQK
jgi:hypothetical protein